MKHPAIFVLLALLLSACSKPSTSTDTPQKPAPAPPQPEYPILVVDEAHQIHGARIVEPCRHCVPLLVVDEEHRGSNSPPAYQISPGPGIRLDGTQFNFKHDSNDPAPNSVQLISTNSLHRLSRETETNFYTIDYYKLETIRGDSFRGFRSGDHLTLVIGRATNTFDAQEIWVMWIAELEVK
jgi:hypothetical protein